MAVKLQVKFSTDGLRRCIRSLKITIPKSSLSIQLRRGGGVTQKLLKNKWGGKKEEEEMEGSTGSGTITRSVVGYRAADTLPLLRAWKRHRLIGAPRLEGIDYFLFIAASKMTGEKGGEMELSRGPGGQKEEEEEIKGKDPLSSLSALPPSLPPFLRLFFCFQPGLIRSNFRLAR